MNDLSSEAGLFRRELRDVRTVTQNTDIRLRRLLEAALPVQRPGGLTARHAFCAVRGFTEKRGAEHVARQLFGTDRELSQLIELKTATGPAMTSSAPWAGELIGTVVQDIADNLLPASVLSQLRELSGNPYLFVDGAVTSPGTHTGAERLVRRRRPRDPGREAAAGVGEPAGEEVRVDHRILARTGERLAGQRRDRVPDLAPAGSRLGRRRDPARRGCRDAGAACPACSPA